MFSNVYQVVKEYPTFSFTSMMILFGFLGYSIVTQYLMDKQIRSFMPKTIFIITFVCSLSLLAMYLYEISLIHLSETLWDFMLSTLVIMCTILIPMCLLLRLPFATYRVTVKGKTKIPIIGIIIIIAYFRILSFWQSQIISKKDIDEQIGIFSKGHINILVQILVNYGVVIMALMSAYGAVWCPYIYFNRTDSKRQELENAKKKTKEQIYFIIEQIKKNKYNILKLKQSKESIQKQLQQKSNNRQSSSMIFRGFKALTGSFSNNKHQEQLSSLNQQIQFHKRELETLHRVHHESFSVYRQIVDEQRKHIISQTFMGKLFKLFSFVLTIYSISRFFLTAWNMIRGRKLSTDPITRFLNLVTWFLNDDINDTFRIYSQYISFGFMGYLMISSVRSFSINIKNFFDFILRRRRLNILSTDTLVLLIAEMYGIYFLSAVILLQSSLPRTYVTNFEHITGEVRLVQHFTLFDKLFFWCCISSIGFIFILDYQRKQKINTIIKDRNFVNLNQ